jgi:hypothetical protein
VLHLVASSAVDLSIQIRWAQLVSVIPSAYRPVARRLATVEDRIPSALTTFMKIIARIII